MGNANHNNSVNFLRLIAIALVLIFSSSQLLAGNHQAIFNFIHKINILPIVLAQDEQASDSGGSSGDSGGASSGGADSGSTDSSNSPPSGEASNSPDVITEQTQTASSSSNSGEPSASADTEKANPPPESTVTSNSQSSSESQSESQTTTSTQETAKTVEEEHPIELITSGTGENGEQAITITKGDIADVQNPDVTFVTSDELESKIEQAAKKEEVVVTPEEIASITNPATDNVINSEENSEVALEASTETVIATLGETKIIESNDLTDVTTATEQYQTDQQANQGVIVVNEDEAKAIQDSITSTSSNNIETAEAKIDTTYGEGWQSTKPYSYDFFADETDTSQESVQ